MASTHADGNGEDASVSSLHSEHDRRDWMKALDSSSRSSYRFFRSRLTDIFKDKRPNWQKHKDIFTIKQQKGQTALDYAGQLRGKQRSYGLSDEILTSVFISGLEANLANVLAIQNPASFSEAVDMASRLESVTAKGKVCSAVEASPLVGYEEILAALSRIEKFSRKPGGDRRDLLQRVPPGGRVHGEGVTGGPGFKIGKQRDRRMEISIVLITTCMDILRRVADGCRADNRLEDEDIGRPNLLRPTFDFQHRETPCLSPERGGSE